MHNWWLAAVLNADLTLEILTCKTFCFLNNEAADHSLSPRLHYFKEAENHDFRDFRPP